MALCFHILLVPPSHYSHCHLKLYEGPKHFFIIPTDAHYYKITGMLKTIKIPTIAPTCFGSRRNRHQGAISCLAKTTIMILLCSSLITWSVIWRHTSLLCKRAVHGRGRHSYDFIIVCISWNNKKVL